MLCTDSDSLVVKYCISDTHQRYILCQWYMLVLYTVLAIEISGKSCFLLSCSEENVWKLCEFVRTERTTSLEELFVIFLSNKNRTVGGT